MVMDLPKEPLFRGRSGTLLQLGREIATGGEGRIHVVAKEQKLVAKLYHQPTIERTAKLKAMLSHPPHTSIETQKQILVAWPLDGILDARKECVGFLMPRVDRTHHMPLFKLYNPRDRLKTAPDFTWRYLLRTAANLASVLAALHTAGYVVGDLNESNILVSRSALVTLVDCDSIQVPDDRGRIFRCPVGKPDYTPPELQGKNFDQVDRTPCHDNFGLAILIFMLLMEGMHPFASSSPEGSDTVPLPQENIGNGLWPSAPSSSLRPPLHALPFTTLPVGLQMLMERCFIHGHHQPQKRPTAQEWYAVLHEAQDHLVHCNKNKQHWYSDHLSTCLWCARKDKTGVDFFPLPMQQPSPALHTTVRKPRPEPRTQPSVTSSRLTARRKSRTLSLIGFLVIVFSVISGLFSQGNNFISNYSFYTPSAYTPSAVSTLTPWWLPICPTGIIEIDECIMHSLLCPESTTGKVSDCVHHRPIDSPTPISTRLSNGSQGSIQKNVARGPAIRVGQSLADSSEQLVNLQALFTALQRTEADMSATRSHLAIMLNTKLGQHLSREDGDQKESDMKEQEQPLESDTFGQSDHSQVNYYRSESAIDGHAQTQDVVSNFQDTASPHSAPRLQERISFSPPQILTHNNRLPSKPVWSSQAHS